MKTLEQAAKQWHGTHGIYASDGINKTIVEAFKAGAKWMAKQGVNLEAIIENHPELVRNSGDHHLLVVEKIDETTNKLPEGKYIVQIRKAEQKKVGRK